MSGKSYTMKEMKAIVEYLTEHRAYGEIKGRKMWMDLASSKITNRTWQSLKETFLKRILPDIHNPYYKLTITQISSFRQGQDIEAKLNNRLKIRSASQNSDTEGVEEKDAEKPGNSNGNIEDEIAGEDPKQSHLRASTETLVLENCYETAEDIRKDLQSPTDHTNEEQDAPPTKSMRELITYSEPLTPMLQSVIDDFVTDDEHEPQMQIVEPEETKEKNNETQCNTQENVTIEISDSEGNGLQDVANQQVSKASSNDHASPTQPNDNNQHAEVVSQAEKAKTNNKDLIILSSESNEANNQKNNSIKNAENEKRNSSETTQNNSTNIADTLLPGNQEAFEKNKPIPQKCNLSLNKNTTLRSGRQRASSQDVETKSKKRKKLDKLKSTSDTEKLQHLSNQNILINSNLSTTVQNLPEECMRSSNANNGLNANNELNESTPVHEEVTDNLQSSVNNNSAGIENPCLKNVSLYAEQFSNEKYTDSEMSNTEDDKNKKGKNGKKDDKNERADSENKISEKENAKTGGQKKNKGKNEKRDKNENSQNTVDDTSKEKNQMEIVENEETAEKSENSTVDKNKTRDNKTENLCDKDNKNIDNKKTADDRNKKDDKADSNSGKTRDEKNDDVVMLELNSDSDGHIDQVRPTRERSVKEQRDRALANVFGFATGDTSRRQRKVTDRRKRTISHSRLRKFVSDSSGSSDWTSDTGSEYVSSPPRKYGRKGKHTRKYLKPRSAPVLSLEEEGGLFVMYGKKIYPIVKDGKVVKSYLSYMPEDEVNTEESFWKLKYVEEKKKTAELTKLLNQAEEGKRPDAGRVPTLSTTTQNDKAVEDLRDSREPLKTVPNIESSGAAKPVEAGPTTEDKKTVKLKFTKKDGEVIDIEGPWAALNPMVQHVAQLCAASAAPPRSRTSSAQRAASAEPVQDSGKSTPIEEVKEKVNQKEREIYEEIEKYHEEEIKAVEKQPEALNVTKRRGRPRKTSPAVQPSPAKKTKPNETAEQNISADVAAQPTGVENITNVTKQRRIRTPKKLLAETVENQNTIRPRRNTPKKPQETTDHAKQTDSYDLDEVRYKFPSPPATRSSSKTTPSELPVKTTRRKTKSDASQATARENIFINSIESTQGYQDSDFSPPIICIQKRRKMRLSYPTHAKRHRRYLRRSHPDITDDISGDSSNSFQGPRIRSMTFKNSTIVSGINRSESLRLLMNKDSSRIKNAFYLGRTVKTSSANDFNAQEIASNDVIPSRNLDPNYIEPSLTSQNSSLASDVYSSESYRLLMNKNPSRIKPTFNLGRIVESSPASDFNEHNKACNEEMTNSNFDPNNVEPIKVTIDNENSSNVSLPTSPVLSIVENISVDKSFLSSLDLDDYAIDDERRDDNVAEQITLNGLMAPYNDVSMPLMQQDCDIEKSRRAGKSYHYNLSATKHIPDVSESLVKRIDSINIQDPVSESFNAKLRDLLLESCKKISAKNIVNNNNEVEEAEVTGKDKPKKITSKKRSSTPRKRQSVKKSTPKNTELVIVEEHMESCSHRSRQSCPPIILVSEHDTNETNDNTPAETESEQFLTVKPTRGRKKKDIIKVKVKKPKPKGRSKSDKYDKNTNVSDSGINDTISDIIQRTNGSVELIHNHSDTCLNAHECMGDSVAVVENSNSIISLVSNSDKSDNTTPAAGDLTQELFSSDAQDGSDMVKEFDFVEPKQVSSGTNTIYHSVPETHSTPNSIMTDDLSEDIPEDSARNNRWYLFSDDELSNIDRDVRVEAPVIGVGAGARLDQIFPITCAVPNLSTITETSRENGDSKKFCDNTNTRDGFNSPNMFI